MPEQEQGIVVATRGRTFEVRTESGAHVLCEVRQKVKDAADASTPVAVGDDVLLVRSHDATGVIEKVLERKSVFGRPAKHKEGVLQVIATNLDRLAIVASIKSPPLKTGLIDRFIVSAYVGGVTPFIIINKIDLGKSPELENITEAYRKIGYELFETSAVTQDGMDQLKSYLAGHRSLFVGHSGVGKSSLLNQLHPALNLKTKEVSSYSNKGTHATTTVELYELPLGGYIVDSPGLKVLRLWEVDRADLPHYYPEFEPFSRDCRFQPCAHIHEPDCAVKEAVESGELLRFRYENYVSISDSLEA